MQALYAQRIDNFSSNYQKSDLKNNCEAISPNVKPISSNRASQEAGWFYQFRLLAARNFLNIMRLPQTSYVKFIVTCLTAGFCIVLFYDVGQDQAGVQNRNGALFFITMTMSFNAIQNVILIFPDERPVFLREANNNMYSVSAYFWAKIFSEFPSSLLTPTIFGAIVYYAIGFNDYEGKFLLFCKCISNIFASLTFFFLFYSDHSLPHLQCFVRLRTHLGYHFL